MLYNKLTKLVLTSIIYSFFIISTPIHSADVPQQEESAKKAETAECIPGPVRPPYDQ